MVAGFPMFSKAESEYRPPQIEYQNQREEFLSLLFSERRPGMWKCLALDRHRIASHSGYVQSDPVRL
jgi:hypothetical protein